VLISVDVGCVAGGHRHVGIAPGFGGRLLGPGAADDHVHLAAARQIQRHDGVFTQPAALHEQDAEVGRHGQ
jgi:hypothetical protein